MLRSRFVLSLICLVFTGLVFTGAIPLASASTAYAVGSCMPHLKSYATISAAVSDPATANSTIYVCPGSYPEQVLIQQPLTLAGVTVNGNSASVVTIPSGTLQVISSLNVGSVGYQIAVVNPGGPVNIKNLITDGTGALFQDNMGYLVGFFYQDSSGTLTDVAARNQQWFATAGVGIVAANGQVVSGPQSIMIQNSVVTNFGMIGIWAIGNSSLAVTIDSNYIDGASSAQVGIATEGYTTGTINTNVVSGVNPWGLTLASSLTAKGNTLRGGISVTLSSNTVEANRIDAVGSYGIMIGGSNNVVASNTIVDASSALAVCTQEFSAPTGNTVIHNKIVNAGVGITTVATGNVISPNTFDLTPVTTQSCD